mmetsp:Transcript_29881/g.102914  ORF Transcript_29881/g.102914 Transcript_29881/m.102914 type:complete len:506 (+) Transcript_29881:139-1656(+)
MHAKPEGPPRPKRWTQVLYESLASLTDRAASVSPCKSEKSSFQFPPFRTHAKVTTQVTPRPSPPVTPPSAHIQRLSIPAPTTSQKLGLQRPRTSSLVHVDSVESMRELAKFIAEAEAPGRGWAEARQKCAVAPQDRATEVPRLWAEAAPRRGGSPLQRQRDDKAPLLRQRDDTPGTGWAARRGQPYGEASCNWRRAEARRFDETPRLWAESPMRDADRERQNGEAPAGQSAGASPPRRADVPRLWAESPPRGADERHEAPGRGWAEARRGEVYGEAGHNWRHTDELRRHSAHGDVSTHALDLSTHGDGIAHGAPAYVGTCVRRSGPCGARISTPCPTKRQINRAGARPTSYTGASGALRRKRSESDDLRLPLVDLRRKRSESFETAPPLKRSGSGDALQRLADLKREMRERSAEGRAAVAECADDWATLWATESRAPASTKRTFETYGRASPPPPPKRADSRDHVEALAGMLAGLGQSIDAAPIDARNDERGEDGDADIDSVFVF